MKQLPLFDGPEGERRKRNGIDRVLAHARAEWKAGAARCLKTLAALCDQEGTRTPFSIDDLRAAVVPVYGEPHHCNVWGGVINRAARAGLIRMAVRPLVPSCRATCHAHKNPQWEGVPDGDV